MTETKTLVDNIKELWNQITAKKDFIIMAAEDLEKSPLTLRQHWFGNFWSIPEEHQPRVVELLQNTIAQQKRKKTSA